LLFGCDNGRPQPEFDTLHPVKGVVKRGGQPVKGGLLQFTPEPNKPEFLINSVVGDDGTYTLTTVRTTDKSGERRTGAPAGTYKVTYTPPLADQTAGGLVIPVDLPSTVTVNAGENNLPIELGKK
jgi:hypothetical protein